MPGTLCVTLYRTRLKESPDSNFFLYKGPVNKRTAYFTAFPKQKPKVIQILYFGVSTTSGLIRKLFIKKTRPRATVNVYLFAAYPFVKGQGSCEKMVGIGNNGGVIGEHNVCIQRHDFMIV